MNTKRFIVIFTLLALILTACGSAATPIIEEMLIAEAEIPVDAILDVEPEPASPPEPSGSS